MSDENETNNDFFCKSLKKLIEDKYPNIKVNMTQSEFGNIFNEVMENCFVCNKNLQRNREFKRAEIYIINEKKKVTKENIKFVCGTCHRMSKIMGSYDMLWKKCMNIFSHYAKERDNPIIYNDAVCNNVCKFKYNDIKRIKGELGYKFDVSENEYISLICGNCKYCGRQSDDHNINDITIINDNMGFTIDNCVTCCRDCKLIRARLSESCFIDHITDITDHYEINKNREKNKMTIRSGFLRLYTCADKKVGIATNIAFSNLCTKTMWSLSYGDEFKRKRKNIFFKMMSENIGTKTHTESIKIDNSMHKIMYIGLSQSNKEMMNINYVPIDFLMEKKEVVNSIEKNKIIVQDNEDISFRVPYNQNCIDVHIHFNKKQIVGLDFICDTDIVKACLCNSCSRHMLKNNGICVCDLCISHLIHGYNLDNCKCSCIPDNDKKNMHTDLKIICDKKIKTHYHQTRYLLCKVSHERKIKIIYDAIDKINSNIMRIHEDKNKMKLGLEKYNIMKAQKTKKQRINKKNELGVDEYRKKQNEYMKSYRFKKSEGKTKEIPKDTKSRKQKQREKMIEAYGLDVYRKIVSLETKIIRYKKAGKNEEDIDQLKNELNRLKQL